MGESALACAGTILGEGVVEPAELGGTRTPPLLPARSVLACAETVRSGPAEGEAQTTAVDQARMHQVVATHFDFIWRSLRRLGIPPEGVDDAAQEVFIVASRKMGPVLPKGERSFLLAITLRIAADDRRTRRRHPDRGEREDVFDLADGTPTPDELLDRRRARDLLDRTIEDLPLDVRAVFVLFEMEELAMSEIAELLQVPAGTVASRLRRGRELFRAALERYRLRAEHPPSAERRPTHRGGTR